MGRQRLRLAAGGFLLLGGRVADRYGRRLVFVSGIVVFAAARFFCGLANSPALLVGSRAVQGLGAAFMAPAALSLLTVIFAEGEERNRALGVWSAIAGAGGAVGLLAGGLLTTALSWRWVFFVNLPIAAIAVVASFRLIDESRNPVAGGFDVPGAVTGTAGLGALVFAGSGTGASCGVPRRPPRRGGDRVHAQVALIEHAPEHDTVGQSSDDISARRGRYDLEAGQPPSCDRAPHPDADPARQPVRVERRVQV